MLDIITGTYALVCGFVWCVHTIREIVEKNWTIDFWDPTYGRDLMEFVQRLSRFKKFCDDLRKADIHLAVNLST